MSVSWACCGLSGRGFCEGPSLVQRCPSEFVCLSVIKCNNNLYTYNKQVDRRQHRRKKEGIMTPWP